MRIGDVATVGPSVMPVYTIVTANAKPAVLLNINRQPDSNTVSVADAIHAEIAQIQKDLPKGVELKPFYDQSEIVTDSITSVRDAILLGLMLASLIMVLFLRDWGTSLVAGLVIPATVALTFIALRALGQTFNLMTLGGLAAAVGLVIDDAIVVVENIVMHRDSGQSRGEAIRSAIREIRVPLVGSTITPDRRLPPADLHHRRDRRILPRPGGHRGRGAADFAGPGAHLDADAQPLLHPPALRPQPRRTPRRAAAAAERLRADAAHHPGAQVGAGRSSPPLLIAGSYFVLPATSAPTCCPRWTKAASSSTTSCPPALRWRRPTA